MTEFPYTFKFYIPATLKDPKVMKLVLSDSFVKGFCPLKYDIHDEMCYSFSDTSLEDLAEFFYINYSFYLESEFKDLICFDEISDNANSIMYYLTEATKISDFRVLLLDICKKIDFFILRGHTEREYKIKHQVIQYYENGGRSEGAVGISRKDFLLQLPGIYSFTVFGSEIITFFTREKLEGMKAIFPNLEYFEGDNYFGFQIDDEHQTLETVIQVQKEIARYLGQEYFFDRDLVGQIEFKPIPTVLEKIK